MRYLIYRIIAKRRNRLRHCRYVTAKPRAEGMGVSWRVLLRYHFCRRYSLRVILAFGVAAQVGAVKVRAVRDLWGLALHEEVLRQRANVHVTNKDGKGAKWLVGCELVEAPCLVEAVDSEREAYRAELFWALADRKAHPEDSRGGPYSSPVERPQETEEIALLVKHKRSKLDGIAVFDLPALARRHVLRRCLNCGKGNHFAAKCKSPFSPHGPEPLPTPVAPQPVVKDVKPRGRPKLETQKKYVHLSGAAARKRRLEQARVRSQTEAAKAAMRKKQKSWNQSAAKKSQAATDDGRAACLKRVQKCRGRKPKKQKQAKKTKKVTKKTIAKK